MPDTSPSAASLHLHAASTAPTRAGPAAAAGGNLSVLQAFRGLAALAVVAYHVNKSIFAVPKYWADRPFGAVLDFGHAGVEFFFVVSGFIILMAHRRDIGQPSSFRSYVWKRFRRIYPVYWVVLALLIPVFFLNPTFGTGLETSPGTLLGSVLLMRLTPGAGQVLSVSWTLFHEILFYGVFALLVLNRQLGAVAMAAWMAASVAAFAMGPEVGGLLGFYASPLHLLFVMGMAAAWAVRYRRVPAPALLLALGALLFTAAGVADVRHGYQEGGALSLLYGLGSALILAGAVELERRGRLSVPRPLVVLGDASYSIYLIHFPALSAMAKVLVMLEARGAALPHSLIFVLLVAAATGLGLLFYRLVEVRLLAWIPR